MIYGKKYKIISTVTGNVITEINAFNYTIYNSNPIAYFYKEDKNRPNQNESQSFASIGLHNVLIIEVND